MSKRTYHVVYDNLHDRIVGGNKVFHQRKAAEQWLVGREDTAKIYQIEVGDNHHHIADPPQPTEAEMALAIMRWWMISDDHSVSVSVDCFDRSSIAAYRHDNYRLCQEAIGTDIPSLYAAMLAARFKMEDGR